MELHNLNGDPNPDPPISGAYIRTLVKHLKTKEPTNPNSSSSSSSNANPSPMAENHNPPPKKQVRRRLHTTRPYQERLLNMAEARREIVTALKYHRASMKKAAAAAAGGGAEQTPPEPPARCEEGKIRPRKIPKSSNNNHNNNNNLRNFCYPSMNPFPSWPMNSQSVGENDLDIVLPEQTLGLNLNLQDFSNLEATLFSNGSVSVSGSSSSPSLSMATDQEGSNARETNSGGGGGMHVAVGEEEMAEIRSIGEKHEMEWSDKMNLVKSAWWLRFMKMGKFEDEEQGFGFGDPFDQILEFPDWMNNGNDICFEQQLFNDYQFFHDDLPSALPCMDIGEFEGMDGEWLA